MLLNCKANMILQSGLGFQFGLISWPVVIVIHARNAHVIDTSLYLVTYPVKSWFLLELINKIYWVETKLKKKKFYIGQIIVTVILLFSSLYLSSCFPSSTCFIASFLSMAVHF